MALPREFKKFKHSTRTSIADARLTYHDAVALVINKLGNPQKGVTTNQISAEIEAWVNMPKQTLIQYMTSAYCGNTESSKIGFKTRSDPNSEKVKTYWYRASKGHYRLTKIGVERVKQVFEFARASKPSQLPLNLNFTATPAKPGSHPAATSVSHAPKPLPQAPVRVPSVSVPVQPVPQQMSILATLRALPQGINNIIKVADDVEDLMKKHSVSRDDLVKIITLLH